MLRFRLMLRDFLRFLILLGISALPLHSAQQAAGAASQSKPAPVIAPDAPPPASAQKAPSAKLADLSWLEGRWRGDWGPRVAVQVWLAPRAGVMLGVFRLIEGDKPLVVELFSMVEKPHGINFYLRHFTSELVPWESSDATVLSLLSVDGKTIDFENRSNGMPKRAIFTRIDADTYIARSELVAQNGDAQIIEITYHRQPLTGPASSAGNGGRRKKP